MLNNKVRIIGGKWRSRKLDFPAVTGLRPTSDRIRETLFNWLAPYLGNAHCLDLFAGSGALGLEAASRGAAHVMLVDNNPQAIKQLQANQCLLNANNVTVYQAKIPQAQLPTTQPFNIIFLDPPFHKGLIASSCTWLAKGNYVAENALIYIESEAELEVLPIPASWTVLKNQSAGQVKYYLIQATATEKCC